MKISQLISCLQRFEKEDNDEIKDVNITQILLGKNSEDSLETIRVRGKYPLNTEVLYAKALAVRGA